MIPEGPRSSPARLFAGIFIAVFFATLLLGGATPPYNDGKQIFDHAENIVYRGEMATNVAPGIKFYSPRPLFDSVIHVPSVALHRLLGNFFPSADSQIRVLTSHLAPAALLATTVVLCARFLLQSSVGVGVVSIVSIILAFSTMLFVFGRVVWSDIVQAFAFWGYFSALLTAIREPSRRHALLLGVWTGVLVNAKYLFVLSVCGGSVLVLWQTRILGLRRQAALVGWAALAALPFAFPIAWFNYLRSGGIFHGGYAEEPFQESLVWGLYSLFFSFGKGFFIYNPVLALSFKPNEKLPTRFWWAVLATCGPVILLYSKYSNWGGDWSWGPRYIIFLVPVLMVPLALWLQSLWTRRRKVALGAVMGVATLGVFIQLLGAGVYWDHFIRLSQAATRQWLGNPNRAGGYTPVRGDHCDPCFEDLHGHTYLPSFQPIEGHYWLLKNAIKGTSWDDAVKDAPWRRYTSLPLDATRRWFPWPPIDWWYLGWTGKLALAGKLIFVVFLLGTGLGVTLWIQGGRRWSRQANPAQARPLPSVDPTTSGLEDHATT
jgi:hypothetical protein